MVKKQINIKTLKKELDWIGMELSKANSFYKIACGLTENIGKYTNVFNDSNTFWYLTHEALMDSSMLRLCRVYEDKKQDRTISLYNIIKHVEEYRKENQIPSNDTDINNDIEYILNDKKVEILRKWRNNAIAHNNKTLISDTPHILDYPLEGHIIQDLINNGFRILNHYSDELLNSIHDGVYQKIDDYKKILERVNSTLK